MPLPSRIDVELEVAPSVASEATPRDVFVVVRALGLRQRVATYTLPAVCFTHGPPTPGAAVPESLRPRWMAIECSEGAVGGATVSVDDSISDTTLLVLKTGTSVQSFAIAANAVVTFGELALARRDCSPSTEILAALRRRRRLGVPSDHELWLEVPALNLHRQLTTIDRDTGCTARQDAHTLSVTCVHAVNRSSTYTLRADADWLVFVFEGMDMGITRTLLPCGTHVTFVPYSNEPLPGVRKPPVPTESVLE